jgi:hypothetical protein
MNNNLRAIVVGALVVVMAGACSVAATAPSPLALAGTSGEPTIAPPIATPTPSIPTPTPAQTVTGQTPVPAASEQADSSATPTPKPSRKPTPRPIPSMPHFPGAPKLVLDSAKFAPSDRGGCGTVYYLDRWTAIDDCGPYTFKLDAEAVAVGLGERLTFAAPHRWTFSVEEIEADQAWSVIVAPIDSLAGLNEGEQHSIPLHGVGTRLGRGAGPETTVSVVAPLEPGEYLLQLDAELERDGWTFTEALYFWRLSVL